jgi:hypothetical protein
LTDSFSDKPPGKSELAILLTLSLAVAAELLVVEVEVVPVISDEDLEDEWPEELEPLRSMSCTTAVPVIAFLSFTCSLKRTCGYPVDQKVEPYL